MAARMVIIGVCHKQPTAAAVGFAGLLIVILRGDEVRGILTELVRTALSVG